MQSQAKDGLTVAERLTLPFLNVYSACCLPPYSCEPHSMAKLAMHCSKKRRPQLKVLGYSTSYACLPKCLAYTRARSTCGYKNVIFQAANVIRAAAHVLRGVVLTLHAAIDMLQFYPRLCMGLYRVCMMLQM